MRMRARPPPRPTKRRMIDSKKPPEPSALVEIQPIAVQTCVSVQTGVQPSCGRAANICEGVKRTIKIRESRTKKRFISQSNFNMR